MKLLPGILFLFAFLLLQLPGVTANPSPSRRPKLVILVSIDQMRSDYLSRYDDLFLPATYRMGRGKMRRGGFKYLETMGAYFVDAQHSHYPLFTAPGHAVLLTGAHPYKSGIVGNNWHDRITATNRYCVEDFSEKLVGASAKTKLAPTSPRVLQVTTVGDELKMATGGKSKVWGIGLKDRAPMLMAGHLADGVLWFDEESGNWVTSTYYAPSGVLPAWVREFNDSRVVNRLTNGVWNFQKTRDLGRVWTWTDAVSHPLSGANYQTFTVSPRGNDLVFELARRLIEKETLGRAAQDERKSSHVSDLLTINLSSNDYVGHYYGPDSAETLDITLETDRQISAFLNWLEEKSLLSRTLFIVTADHGVSPLPIEMKSRARFKGGRGFEAETAGTVNQYLAAQYGLRGTNAPAKVVEFNIYIEPAHLAQTNDAPERIHEKVARFLSEYHPSGIYAAYTREQILTGALPRTEIATRVMNGYFPGNSGDIVVVLQPYWIQLSAGSKYQSSHGSPYSFDTSVPLLMMGPGIARRKVLEPTSTLDIAPTVSYLLGILKPSGCEGRILSVCD